MVIYLVDKYLNCTRPDCDGVAVREGADPRSKTVKYRCRKCGNDFSISRKAVEFGKHVFLLNDPRDQGRSGLK